MNRAIALAKGCLIFVFVFFVLSIPSLSEPGLNLTKSCNLACGYLGDTMIYSFNILNNGTEALDDLALFDDHLGEIALDDRALDVGESCNVNVSYKIAEADVEARILLNTARASAKCKGIDVFSNNASFEILMGTSGP
jgi:hypothetical protein